MCNFLSFLGSYLNIPQPVDDGDPQPVEEIDEPMPEPVSPEEPSTNMPYRPKYFTISELCQSNVAFTLGIKNKPSEKETEHMLELIEYILDPLREAWGAPIIVTSGFRCDELNAAVGGSKTSVHPYGWAVDIVPKRTNLDDFGKFIKKWVKDNDIAFDQIIFEKNAKGDRWVHIGLYNRQGKQRRKLFSMAA